MARTSAIGMSSRIRTTWRVITVSTGSSITLRCKPSVVMSLSSVVRRFEAARSERALAGDLFRGGERLDQGLPAPGRARRVHQTRVLKIEEEPRDQAERVLALG